jgi:hypothetical protein
MEDAAAREFELGAAHRFQCQRSSVPLGEDSDACAFAEDADAIGAVAPANHALRCTCARGGIAADTGPCVALRAPVYGGVGGVLVGVETVDPDAIRGGGDAVDTLGPSEGSARDPFDADSCRRAGEAADSARIPFP